MIRKSRHSGWIALFLCATGPGLAQDGAHESVAQPQVAESTVEEASLYAQFDPLLSPLGSPWAVTLFRRQGGRMDLSEAIAKARLAEDGVLDLRELEAGEYLLVAADTDGAHWAEQEVNLSIGENVMQVSVPMIEVVGSIRHDREPVAGRLWFGPGPSSDRRILMESDSDGEFVGFLPEAGVWEVDLEWTAEDQTVALEPVEVRMPRYGRQARVDIRLPFTTVEGTVIDENQVPVAAATVRLVSTKRGRKKRVSERTSAEDGTFRFVGMTAGLAAVQATAPVGDSDWSHLTLMDGFTPAPFQLVLRQRKTQPIRVVSDGRPVAGARVVVMPQLPGPSLAGPAESIEDLTDLQGLVSIALPAKTEEVSLVTMALGHALSVGLHSVGDQEILVSLSHEAGTLELLEPHPRAVVVHDGVQLPLPLLRRWSLLQGDAATSLHTVVARNVEPGEYSYCLPLQVVLDDEESEGSQEWICYSGELAPLDYLALSGEAG